MAFTDVTGIADLIAYAKEAVSKLWSLGKLLSPVYAIYYFIKTVWTDLITLVTTWLSDKIDYFKGLIAAQFAALNVDLSPSGEIMSWLSKFNSVVPLAEAVHYLVLYLAFASVLLGMKWARNLIPGVS